MAWGSLAVAAALVQACTTDSTADRGLASDAVSAGNGAGVVYLEQGWDEATRTAFYTTTQGSRMLPYEWFVNLEQADGRELLRDPSHLRPMGFLVNTPPSDANPDHLPVGFARDVDPVRGDSLGLTCAACHTGEIEYGGRRIRIDGGQSLADLEQLQWAIHDSLGATLADTAKFRRFATKILGSRVRGPDIDALRSEMTYVRDWWAARLERSAGLTPHGPGRTDAFTIIGNEVVCDLFEDPRNCAPAVAPTQYPFLWDTWDFEWVQYNSSVHSPLGRNVGQVTGVFADAELDPTNPYGLMVKSSANVENLHALETWLTSLESPAWPEDLLGEIDDGLAAQGEAIYATACASCHTLDPQPRTEPNAYGQTFAMTDFSTPLFPGPNGEIPPQGLLGTDATAALAFATRRAYPGPFAPIAEAQGLVGPDGKASVAALLNVSGRMIIERFFLESGFSDFEKLAFLDFREPLRPSTAQLLTYKARPLNGVAFTPPYLHNGSVPSIYELLLPPSERSTSFYVGSMEYDPVHLGYSTEAVPGAVLIDTTAVGNGNGGHYWGTDLTHDQRMALIEYIKTL